MNSTLSSSQQSIGDALKDIKDKKHNEALNVIISVALLTKDKENFIIPPKIQIQKHDNIVKVWLAEAPVFEAIIEKEGVNIPIFVRGEWEQILENHSGGINGTSQKRIGSGNTEPKLRSRDRGSKEGTSQ